MQSGGWTPEHSQALRECLARGVSFARAAAEINARFGTFYTRSAALGRGKRMGLMVSNRRPERRSAAKAAARACKAADPARKTKAGRPARSGSCRDGAPPPAEPAAIPTAQVQLRCVGIAPRLISIVELEPGDCRYPYGGDRDDDPIAFCGHPRRAGSSYCEPHFHLTRGIAAGSERAVAPIALRLVRAA